MILNIKKLNQGTLCILLTVLCVSCTAKPNLINGKYYMGGDSDCRRYRPISDSRIMCQNSEGEDTGWRDAMTDQELQMYQHEQVMEQQQQAINAINKPIYCNHIGNQTFCN